MKSGLSGVLTEEGLHCEVHNPWRTEGFYAKATFLWTDPIHWEPSVDLNSTTKEGFFSKVDNPSFNRERPINSFHWLWTEPRLLEPGVLLSCCNFSQGFKLLQDKDNCVQDLCSWCNTQQLSLTQDTQGLATPHKEENHCCTGRWGFFCLNSVFLASTDWLVKIVFYLKQFFVL